MLMSENIVTLKTGFQIAHGQLEAIKEQLGKSGVCYSCVDCSALFKASANPSLKVENSSATHLRKYDLVEEDGSVPEAVRHVVLSAAGYESEEAAQARGEASCSFLNLQALEAE